MLGVYWLDADALEGFRSFGATSILELCSLDRGKLVSEARTRKVRRVELDGVGYFVKVQDLRTASLPVRKWPSYAFRGSPVYRDGCALHELRKRGFLTPDVIACGQERGFLRPTAAVLITRELEDCVDLAAYLEKTPDPEARLRAIRVAEQLVRRVHEAGIALLGAKYRNILIPRAGTDDPDELALVDQPDLRVTQSTRLRAKDWRHMEHDKQRYGPANDPE